MRDHNANQTHVERTLEHGHEGDESQRPQTEASTCDCKDCNDDRGCTASQPLERIQCGVQRKARSIGIIIICRPPDCENTDKPKNAHADFNEHRVQALPKRRTQNDTTDGGDCPNKERGWNRNCHSFGCLDKASQIRNDHGACSPRARIQENGFTKCHCVIFNRKNCREPALVPVDYHDCCNQSNDEEERHCRPQLTLAITFMPRIALTIMIAHTTPEITGV